MEANKKSYNKKAVLHGPESKHPGTSDSRNNGIEMCGISITDQHFPALGEKHQKPLCIKKSEEFASSTAATGVDHATLKKKKGSNIRLCDFINTPKEKSCLPSDKKINNTDKHKCAGNRLDSAIPERKRGKCKEQSEDKKLSKIKQERIESVNNGMSLVHSENTARIYCDHSVTEELNEITTTFINRIVTLQEKAYKKDPIKAKFKRRYVVGFHEVNKHLLLNRVKLIIIAPDLKITKSEDTLHLTIKELINLSNLKQVPFVFALKRRLLGKLLLKHIPVSSMAILNYESIEDQMTNILSLVKVLKQQYKLTGSVGSSTVNEELINSLLESFKEKQLE